MTDILSKKRRSWNMSRIKSVNTRPENIVASFLRKFKIKYRRHVSSLPGRPDFMLSERNKLIFVHGCFWHRHKCKNAVVPSTNKYFWLKKFKSNVQHDKKVATDLNRMKYKVLILWECQVEKFDKKLENRIRRFAEK